MEYYFGVITSIPELITFFEAQKHYTKLNKSIEEKENEKASTNINSNDILGVVEASNNLVTSNTVNLFIIQTIGILLYYLVI